MLFLSHGAEWAGPESEEYCDAPAGEKKMYFRKTQQIVILPRKNSCVTHPWGYSTVQQPAASLAFGAFLHRLKTQHWRWVLVQGYDAARVLGELLRHGAMLRPPKQDIFCYPYLLEGTGTVNMPPNKTFFLNCFFLIVISYALYPVTSLSLWLC